jgi:apolipoprotein N-acyltransferase
MIISLMQIWNQSSGLSGRWRGLMVLLLGALSGLAMPPVNAWWIFGLTVPLFLSLLQWTRRPFLSGWVFGFGYFLVVLHWIGFAFFVDAKVDLWMMPFAVGGLSGAAAVYWGLAAFATRLLMQRGLPIWLAYPICLSIAEWLRGFLFTGFPWAVPGLAVDGMGGVDQLASIIGMNGLTLLILFWATAPLAYLVDSKRTAIAVLLTLPLAWGWGAWRLAQNPTQHVAGVGVRLVQPNISQSDKWRGDNARAIFDQLLTLSAKPSDNGIEVTHLIWPESALPFLIDESAAGRAELALVLAGKKILLTGAVRRSSPKAVNGVEPNYFTSVLMFDGDAKVIGVYDKSHLVPGGEYLPFAWLLEPLGFRKVVSLPESFSAGPGPEAIAVPGAGFAGMQICYEAIFPNGIVNQKQRPDWLVNVTNDGWFGNSSGPYQHLAQLRLRAIEQGLPVARAANTGISAVIDPVGRYLEITNIDEQITRDSMLPKKIQPTVYSIFGDFGLLFLLIIVTALFTMARNYV